MNRKVMARVGSFALVGAALLAASGTAATSMSACGESGACTTLRQTEFANLLTWQACDPAGAAGQCIIEAGNPKDCTGVLSCNFAVNARFRAQAESAVYSSGESSQGCYLCATPSCIAAEIGVCEPISRRCIGVSGETSTGGLVFAGEDAGGTGSTSSSSGGTILPTGDGGGD